MKTITDSASSETELKFIAPKGRGKRSSEQLGRVTKARMMSKSDDYVTGEQYDRLLTNPALVMVVKFVKISSKSTAEAVREKSTRIFSKKYVIHHQAADFKIKNYSC